jgi:hypothetical protein
VAGKLVRLPWEFYRYSRRIDWMLLLGFAGCLVLLVGQPRQQRTPRASLVEIAILCGVFLAMYLILPVGKGGIYFIDVRPLAFVPLLIIVASLLVADGNRAFQSPAGAVVLSIAALLSLANLVYLAKHLNQDDRWMEGYRRVVAQVPRGSHVMLIDTLTRDRHVLNPFLHAGEYIVIDRAGITPDVFSLNGGNPVKYFRYLNRPYVPESEDPWYRAWPKVPVDWAAVACDYQYLLITRPFDPTRIGVATTIAAQNENAVLLGIATPCGRPHASTSG